MPKIEATDGENVAVTIKDGWVEKIHTKHGDRLVVQLIGADEKGATAKVTLWMSDEQRDGQDRTDIERNLDLLESLGMEDGNISNLVDLFDKPAAFSCRVKDDKTTFYLRSPVEKLDLDEAAKMIEAIRGKAAMNSDSLRGEPVDGDDNLVF